MLRTGILKTWLLTTACLCGLASARPGAWLDLSPLPRAAADGQRSVVVELDVASVEQGPVGPEASVRVKSIGEPWTHRGGFTYSGFDVVLRMDCAERGITPIAATYYDQDGAPPSPVATETDLNAQGISPELLAHVPAEVQHRLLRVACTRI